MDIMRSSQALTMLRARDSSLAMLRCDVAIISGEDLDVLIGRACALQDCGAYGGRDDIRMSISEYDLLSKNIVYLYYYSNSY